MQPCGLLIWVSDLFSAQAAHPAQQWQVCLAHQLNLQSVEGQRLLKRYQKIRAHLLVFLTDETIPPTNNASEQALGWSVVFQGDEWMVLN